MDDQTFYFLLGLIGLAIFLLYRDIARIEYKRRLDRLEKSKRRHEHLK